jgi:hypothetical protein
MPKIHLAFIKHEEEQQAYAVCIATGRRRKWCKILHPFLWSLVSGMEKGERQADGRDDRLRATAHGSA